MIKKRRTFRRGIENLQKELNNLYDDASEAANAIEKENANVSIRGISKERWSKCNGLTSDRQNLVTDLTTLSLSNKGVYNAVIACLLKKIDSPTTDIRRWSTDPEIGWPGWGYDLNKFGRKLVAPFFIDKGFLEALANSTRTFLTGNLKIANRKYDLKYPHKIQPEKMRNAFLKILDDVQCNGADPEKYITAILTRSICYRREREKNAVELKEDIGKTPWQILSIMDRHISFDYTYKGKDTAKNTSVLPVLAIWSLQKCRIENDPFVSGLKLDMYEAHHATDSPKSPGDVNIRSSENDLIYRSIDLKGLDKQLTYEEVKSACDKKIVPAMRRGGLQGGYFYVCTEDRNLVEKQKIKQLSEEIFRQYGRKIHIVSFDEYMEEQMPMVPDCGKMLTSYYNEVKDNRYNDLSTSHLKELSKICRKEKLTIDDRDVERSKGVQVKQSSNAKAWTDLDDDKDLEL